MARTAVRALTPLVAASLAIVLLGNAVWVLLQPWLIDAQYTLPGFPVDRGGVQDPARTELAKTGVRAVQFGGDGVAPLEAARLPDGRPAFEPREIRHMADVRDVVSGLFAVWLGALAVGVASAGALWRLGGSAALRRALERGGRITFVATVLIGAAMVVGFDVGFAAVHDLLFAPGSWRFADRLTLRQLYPDAFWAVAGAALAFLVLAQAALVVVALDRARRRLVGPA